MACYFCGYPTRYDLQVTKWNGHKVHLSCLQGYAQAQKIQAAMFAKIQVTQQDKLIVKEAQP